MAIIPARFRWRAARSNFARRPHSQSRSLTVIPEKSCSPLSSSLIRSPPGAKPQRSAPNVFHISVDDDSELYIVNPVREEAFELPLTMRTARKRAKPKSATRRTRLQGSFELLLIQFVERPRMLISHDPNIVRVVSAKDQDRGSLIAVQKSMTTEPCVVRRILRDARALMTVGAVNFHEHPDLARSKS